MKILKKLLILNTFFVFLYANELSLGLKSFNNKEFNKAYKYYKNLEKKNILNTNEIFILARSSFELGLYNESLVYYEKILLGNPNNLRIELEIANCYYKLGNFEKSKNLLNKVLLNNIPPQVRYNINLLLSNINKTKEKDNSIEVNFQTAFFYDSNIENTTHATSVDIYFDDYLTNLTLDEEKKSDTYSEVILTAGYNKLLDSMVLLNNLTYYNKTYSSFSEHNKQLIQNRFSIYINENTNKSIFTFLTNFLFENKKFVLNTNQLLYEKEIDLMDSINRFSLYLTRKDYYQNEYDGLDSNSYGLMYSYFINDDTYGRNTFSVNFEKENEIKNLKTDVNKNLYQIEYLNELLLFNTLVLNNQLRYEYIKYKDIDINFDSKRVDEFISYKILLTYILNKKSNISLEYSSNFNYSNHDIYDYKKELLGLRFSYKF